MITYEKCKQIAEKKAESYGAKVDKAYTIGHCFAFDTNVEVMGVFPLVVDNETGKTEGLWHFLHRMDYTMDYLREIKC